ncbi:MAG: GDP-L-fucose synthase [Rhodospirillales bacterium]|nr:GDP-L-fucose synthase [Rhodospirillales bacterium]
MAGAIQTPDFPLAGRRVFVAGHRGMVGAAIARRLAAVDCEVLTAGRETVDLTRQRETEDWLAAQRPDAVILAAARVGGIHANNSRPAEFIYENLAIETNVIHAAWRTGVKKLLFLGSSCVYPRLAAQPMHEDALLTGPLEPTNQWYAVAKIAGLKMCQAYRRQYGCNFISVMPTNIYGPGDNYDLEQSHVIGALMVKTHRAKVEGAANVEIWGTGTPRREFLYVDDLADAVVFVIENYAEEQTINIGVGRDVTIRELAETVAGVVGFRGSFAFNTSRPDGVPQKLLDVTRLARLGWTAKTPLRDGLARAYAWFLDQGAAAGQTPPRQQASG